jgi:hypothetical protein
MEGSSNLLFAEDNFGRFFKQRLLHVLHFLQAFAD